MKEKIDACSSLFNFLFHFPTGVLGGKRHSHVSLNLFLFSNWMERKETLS